MSYIDSIAFVLAGLLGVGLIVYGLAGYLSPDAKEARRRRRNHGRIITKAHRPTVKFSAKTK